MKNFIFGFVFIWILVSSIDSFAEVINQGDLNLGKPYAQCIKKAGTVEAANTCIENAGKVWENEVITQFKVSKILCQKYGSDLCVSELDQTKTNWLKLKEGMEGYTSSVMGFSQIGLTQMLMNTALMTKAFAQHLQYVNSALIEHNK